MQRKLIRNLDYQFLLALLAILTMSVVVLYSASAAMNTDPYYYVKKHVMWVVLGLGAMLVTTLIDYNQIIRYGRYFYVLNLLILIAVLVPGIGYYSKGAQGWFKFGSYMLQPAEFSKIAMIIAFSQFLVTRQGKLERFRDLIPCFALFAAPVLLILKQPDLGTSLVFFAILFGMLFIGGARPALVVGILTTGILAVVGIIWAHFNLGLPLPLQEYQLMRLVVFLDPYNDGFGGRKWGYNVIQSMVAIGSGGWLGKGLTQGSQVQLNFLPEHHTDFIFSVVGEELGFVGAAGLLGLYLWLLYRAMRIASEAKDLQGTLLVMGSVSMIFFHIFVNVGMTISMMPITGIPLPLFSYGGSSMLANMIAMGLVLNVNLRRQKIVF